MSTATLTRQDATGTLHPLSCGRFMCEREACVTLGGCAALRLVREGERCSDCPHSLAEHDEHGCDGTVGMDDPCGCQTTRLVGSTGDGR